MARNSKCEGVLNHCAKRKNPSRMPIANIAICTWISVHGIGANRKRKKREKETEKALLKHCLI
jgi:hypothetical protein